MQIGESAEIELPRAFGSEAECQRWRPKLLHRVGSKEANVFIWLGDSASSFPVIYFAFAPLRKKRQFFKLVHARACLEADLFFDEHARGQATIEFAATAATKSIKMLSYVQRKLTNLWQNYGFQEKLDDTMARYPNHLFLFCGISHGAALAQATTLKLSMMYPTRKFQAATWNAYKWTDESGVAQMSAYVGKRLLSFVMSQGNDWDSIAGAPHDLEAMREIVFLDTDSGECRPALDVGRSRIGPITGWRMYRLHFAKTALRGMRAAMVAAAEGASTPSSDRLRLRSRTLSWPTREGFMRAWSFHRPEPLSSMTEQEEELLRVERDNNSDSDTD